MPPKAIQALLLIKSELLSRKQQESVTVTPEPPRKAQKESKVRMRHARSSGGAFQRMCRRKDWAAPVY